MISIIVTTYNRVDALQQVLLALADQDYTKAYEVIIADDGSSEETAVLLRQLQPRLSYPLHHVWQEDRGFRAARARNRAAAKARGDYLIFIDGDCLVFPDFISAHLLLRQRQCFVAGNRVLLSPQLSANLPDKIWQYSFWQFLHCYLKGEINRLLPLLRSRVLNWLVYSRQHWQGVKTCNLALYKADFVHVNGFDEAFTGWGHEDADLAVRLLNAGIRRKNGKFMVPVLHLWHRENDRSMEVQNKKRLNSRLQQKQYRVKQGVSQYLHE